MDRQTIATKSEKTWNAWCLAVKVVPPSDTCRNSGIRGAWRLATRYPH